MGTNFVLQRNIHQRHWFGGVCMMTFMSVSSTPFPFLKKSLQNAPTSRDQLSSLDWGRNSPHFALFDGVHGTAQGTDKVSCKIWTVREGALEIKCDDCNLFWRQENLAGSHLNAEHSWTVRSGLDPLLQRLVPILWAPCVGSAGQVATVRQD